jgi:predicted RNase H-like HicB family nuclease
MQTLTLEYWRDEGWYVGRLRENPAVMSQGQTLGELQDNIRDAFQELLATEEPAPVGRVETIEIKV